jgi:hypothetical protein
MGVKLKIPFPWFGGKSMAADLIWSRFGTDCGNYVEPFFGSGAVWHNRPAEYRGWSCVNDLDGNICNVWRSMQQDSDAVAEAACWPVNECDLHARHLWLVNNLPKLASRLMADPSYCEPTTAGWYIWGACIWIGGGWCNGDGPWHAVPDAEGVLSLVAGTHSGRGVNRQLPHLNGGRGVNRKHDGERLDWLKAWFAEFATSLADTRVACGDWERIMTPGIITLNGVCAVLLDPPYSQTDAVYAYDSSTVAQDVRGWCKANGGNAKLRIALCGHEGEHNELEGMGWSVETWTKMCGYSSGKDTRERIWFSPYCVPSGVGDMM